MIRTVLALFVFALVLCGLIIFQPFSGTETAAQDPLGTAVAPEVTRAAPSDIAGIAAAALNTGNQTIVDAPVRVDVPRPTTDDTELSDMTNNVLAQMGFAGVERRTTNTQIQRQSTASILAGIEAATGQASALQERHTLESIVVAALQAGQSDDEIDALVNDAAAVGAVAVPQILVTSEGRVDTHVLLNDIVTQAQIAAGAPAPAIPELGPDDIQGMEVRVIQRATDEVQARFYTVQPGDSLGAISITFYGAANYYTEIFQANRALISSPDRIRVGQRLVIPNLNG